MKRIEYTSGQRLGSLVFLRESEPKEGRRALFKCLCGKNFKTSIRSATSGNTKSCGCFTGLTPRKDRKATHCLRYHPIYRVWCSIKTRCYNPKRTDYPYYGGSGIRMSKEFRSDFQSFFSYVTKLPRYEQREESKLTLDRVKNSGNYQRGNLRWSTRKEQANNRRNNV